MIFKLVSEYVTANTVQNNLLSRDRQLILPYCLQIFSFFNCIKSSSGFPLVFQTKYTLRVTVNRINYNCNNIYIKYIR